VAHAPWDTQWQRPPLGEASRGTAKQRRLLETEGVLVGRVIDMKIYGWSFRRPRLKKAAKRKRRKTA
jgi:hypothetical protein